MAVVTSHPIQYQAPWFRALARVVDLEVYFCHRQDANGQAAAGYQVAFEWDVPLLEGYRYHWLANRSHRPTVFSYGGCDTPGVDTVLASGGFDACIVNGWYLKSYVQALRACWKHRIKVLVRGDSQLATKRSALKSVAKWAPYRFMLNRVDAHLYVGHANKAYLRHYGVPERKLFFVPHFVDNEFFAASAERARTDGTAAGVRSELGVPSNAIVVLFVGRLVDQKRVHDLIAALARLKQTDETPFHGVLVGSGPLLTELRALASSHRAAVHFAGFRNQSELPRFYAAADVLVLPSDARETWGLVVNEAMACGLPAVVSDAVGCGLDLVDEGRTGYRFPVGDAQGLADRLTQMRADIEARPHEIRSAIQSRIARYSCSTAVEATLGAIGAVGADGHRRSAMGVEA